MSLPKQDRHGARTTTDLERKYQFGKQFAEVMGVATDAQKAADEAASVAGGLDEKLDQTEIFNRLTNNGQAQGIFKGDDGELYINASYLVTGIIKSPDGESVVIDLDNGNVKLTGSLLNEFKNGDYSTYAKLDLGYLETAFGDCVGTYSGVGFGIHDTSGKFASLAVTPSRSYLTGLTEPINDADAANKAYVDGMLGKNQNVLWNGGALLMVENDTATLSKKVSEQATGIVLVFSAFVDGKIQNYDFNYLFVPKYMVGSHNGNGSSFMLTAATSKIGTKYLYIGDEAITGHSSNIETVTANGVTYTNSYFVLRYVIGV